MCRHTSLYDTIRVPLYVCVHQVELEHQVFAEDEREKAMEIPENVTGPAFLWRMNKPAPLNETRLGTEGLPAVAKWWDRMNAHYI